MEESLDRIWKALSDPTRRQLLDRLRSGPLTTGQLCEGFSLSRFAIMKHLDILQGAGLVLARREGRQVWHYLNAVPLRQIYERWVSAYESHWAGALLRLKHESEGARMEKFRIEQEVLIQADPQRVFQCLLDPDAWWSHSFKPARRVRLEPHAGGRFYEEFADDSGGALYAMVTYVEPGRKLVLSGPMGMDGPVVGTITFTLQPEGTGTLLHLSHRVVGEVDENLHRNYTAGWRELLEVRLRQYAEQGVRLQR